MLFFTSDTHFGHDNIRRYLARPYATVEEMDTDMIKRWNAVVSPQDTVYHLGDFAWRDIAGYRAKLNGNINLIRGNHDREKRTVYEKSFASYKDYARIKLPDKTNIILFHYPIDRWDKCHFGSWHLFGHCHGNLFRFDRAMDVGVDCHSFVPLSLDVIRERMESIPAPKPPEREFLID